AVMADVATARLQTQILRQPDDFTGSATALAVAINVKALQRVMNVPTGLGAREILARRIRLMTVAHDRVKDGDRLLLISHAVGNVGLLPRLECGDILLFIGNQI